MALILGHSQVHEYLVSDKIWTLCYPGFRSYQFIDLEIVAEMVPSFPVSTTYIIYRFTLNVLLVYFRHMLSKCGITLL